MSRTPPGQQPYPHTITRNASSPAFDWAYPNGDRPTGGGGDWTVTDNFEGGTLGQQTTNGLAATVYSNEQAAQGTQSGKMTINSGSVGNDWGCFLDFGTQGSSVVAVGTRIWYKAKFFFPNGWSFDSQDTGNTGFKLMRIQRGAAGYFSVLVKPGGFLRIDMEGVPEWFTNNFTPPSNPAPGEDVGGYRDAGQLTTGVWHTVEMQALFSPTDGVAEDRIWLDDTLVFQSTATKNLPYNASANRTLIGTYWNGNATQTQSCYVDSVEWTTTQPAVTDAAGNFRIGTA